MNKNIKWAIAIAVIAIVFITTLSFAFSYGKGIEEFWHQFGIGSIIVGLSLAFSGFVYLLISWAEKD